MTVHTDNPIPAIIAVALLACYWTDLAGRLQRRRRYAKWIAAWRQRITTIADYPFHTKLLTKAERAWLIGRDGLTSDEWARQWAADFIAGRRNQQPTCADYLREFGEQPTVRPAKTRTPVRN